MQHTEVTHIHPRLIIKPPSVTGVAHEGESLQGLQDWKLIGYKMQGEWSATVDYKTGDVVRNKGFVYIVKDSLTKNQMHLIQSRGYYDPGSLRRTEFHRELQLLITEHITEVNGNRK